MRVQFGGEPKRFKPMLTVGAGAYETRVPDKSGAHRDLRGQARDRCLRAGCLSEEVAADCEEGYRACEGAVQIDWRQNMRKKIDPRFSDMRRIKSSGNVFLDLGFDPAELRSWRCAPR
jgi:hypothetical protein